MDIKVYKKEEVSQPQGSEYVFVPDVIDLIPVIETDLSGNEILAGCTELNDSDKELLEQQCALATIFQRGLDPLDKEDGIRWSEALLGEINPVQLMDEIQSAVEKTTSSVTVVFEVVTDSNGKSYLSYVLKEVA